jgi:VWFA-related protein
MAFIPKFVPFLAACAAAATLAAQDTVFRASVDIVAVDVAVVGGDGRPVNDLAASDFAITVDGRPRPVVSATFVAQEATHEARAALASLHFTTNEYVERGRYVLVAVDEAHIRRLEGKPALAAAARFIDGLDPLDRVAVAGLTRVGDITFTRDRARAKEQLARLGGQTDPVFLQFNIGLSEAMEVADGSRAKLSDVILRECGRTLTEYANLGRAGSGAAGGDRDACPEQVEQEARAVAQHARSQARISLSALESIVESLSEIEGPKTLVILSEGMAADPRHLDLGELAEAARAARVSIYVLQLEVPIFEAADSRPSPTFFRDVQLRAEGLGRIAGAARGALFRLVGSDHRPFDRIARELSGYYLLGFEARPADRDGRSHRINVSLRRRGLDVRARPAFQIPAVAPSARAREEDLVALLRTSRPATELPVRVATYTYSEPSSPNLRVVVSTEAQAAAGPAARILLGYVLLDAGGVIAASGAMRSDAGRHAFSTLVPPGDYTLRVAGIDPLGRRGLVERPFAARVTASDAVRVSDLIVAPVPASREAPLQPVVDRVADPRVTMYIEIYANDGTSLRDAAVTFEVALDESAPATVTAAAEIVRRDARWLIARAVLPLERLAPGGYLARAEISTAAAKPLRIIRPFTFLPPPVERD